MQRENKWQERFDERFTGDTGYTDHPVDEIKSFIQSELDTAIAEERGKAYFELLQVFNDYEVPLMMTAEDVKEIITNQINK